jgi:hypothetical protein
MEVRGIEATFRIANAYIISNYGVFVLGRHKMGLFPYPYAVSTLSQKGKNGKKKNVSRFTGV